MNDKHLAALLRDADRTAVLPQTCGDDLAGRVRRSAHRRRTVVRAGSASVAALVVAGGALAILDTRGKGSSLRATRDGTPAPADVAPPARLAVVPEDSGFDAAAVTPLDDAHLRIEADVRLRVVEKLRAAQRRRERLDRLEEELSAPDPFQRIDAHVEKAAFIRLQQAERLRRTSNRRADAITAYRRVVKLFPRTRWAKVADQRLSEIENRKGDVL